MVTVKAPRLCRLALTCCVLGWCAPCIGETIINGGTFYGTNVVAANAHSWGYYFAGGWGPDTNLLLVVDGFFQGGALSGQNAHSYGLLSDGSGSLVRIETGEFRGGTAEGMNPHTYGVFNNGGEIAIHGGLFVGGNGYSSQGIYNNGGSVAIFDGLFQQGTGTFANAIYNNGGALDIYGGSVSSVANNGGLVMLYAEALELGPGLSTNEVGKVLGTGLLIGNWLGTTNEWSLQIKENSSHEWSTNSQGIFLAVPEPSTYALLAMSAAGALWWARRRR